VSGSPLGRCVGLVGGLGPAAAAHVYRELVKAHAARGLTLDLVMVHADVARIFAAASTGDLDGLSAYLAGLAGRLQAAGARFVAIPAATPHICMPQLAKVTPLPVVSLVDAVKRGLARRGLRRIALFGTRFSVETAMFGELAEFDVVTPRAEEISAVHDIYVAIVAAGGGAPEQLETLRALARKLISRERLDAIVLAGTDLALLMDEASAGFPAVDCAALHVEAIADEAARRAA
jgi:aspartate racemase